MGKFSILILILVVLSHGSVRGDHVKLPSSHLEDDYQAPRAHPEKNQSSQMEEVKFVNLPPYQTSDASMNLLERDDDHSNIELDKLTVYRYELLPADPESRGESSRADTTSLNGLLSKVADYHRLDPNEFARAQWDRARRVSLNSYEDDKDYSFVGNSLVAKPTTAPGYNTKQIVYDRKWAQQMVRNMLLSRAKAQRFSPTHGSQNGITILDQPIEEAKSQHSSGFTEANVPAYRPSNYRGKRRHCKVVLASGPRKGSTSCDTDAFFSANDYSLREVWDGAGKRR